MNQSEKPPEQFPGADSAAPESPERKRGTVTAILLALSLALFNVAFALQLAFAAGVVASAIIALILAVPLEKVGALDSDYFPSVQVALVAVGLTFLMSASIRLGRAVGRLWSPTAEWTRPRVLDLPTSALLLLLAFSFCVLTPLDLLGLHDVDDSKLGAALLTVSLGLGLLAGTILLVLAWRLSRFLWRVSGPRPVLAGALIVLLSIPPIISLAASSSSQPDPKPFVLREVVEASRQKLVLVAHASLGDSAARAKFESGEATPGGNEPSGSDDLLGALGLEDEATRRWEECFNTLHSPPPTPSPVIVAINRVQSGGAVNRADAEDLVHKTLLSVCVKQKAKARTDLREYFDRSVTYAIYGRWRGPWVCSEQPVEDCDLEATDDFIDEQRQAARNAAVQQALCHVEKRYPKDVVLLRMRYFENLSAPEIADRLGVPKQNVRQRLVTAQRRLLAELPQWCRPLGRVLTSD